MSMSGQAPVPARGWGVRCRAQEMPAPHPTPSDQRVLMPTCNDQSGSVSAPFPHFP